MSFQVGGRMELYKGRYVPVDNGWEGANENKAGDMDCGEGDITEAKACNNKASKI